MPENIPVHFRYFKPNMQSIASLMPQIPGTEIVREPRCGIMLYSFATTQAQRVYMEVERSRTGSVFIAGGPHPSARPEEALRFFDYVVIGEGEGTLPELLCVLKNKGDVSSVRGIAYKEKGRTVFTEKRDNVNLDSCPPFDVNGIRSTIEITRGCPYSCAYCQTPQLFGHAVRHRGIDGIARYAKCLGDVRFTSPNAFAYGSDGTSPRIEKIEALFRALSGMKIFFGTFPSEVRPEFINDRVIELVSSHCANNTLNMGGQSGSARMLGLMRRGHTVDDIIKGVEICLTHGITPVVDFIFGLPGETGDDQCDTLSLIKWLTGKGGKVHSHYFMSLPGTEFEDRAPAPLSKYVEKTMGKLALAGKTTGVWSDRGIQGIDFSGKTSVRNP